MTRKLRAKVGVIGLGLIGSRVAASLRAAGHQVYVWNRSPRSEPNFLGSAAEVAALSDVVQIFVGDDQSLVEVVRAVADALTPRHVVTAHATVSPYAAREAAAAVAARGARYLDAPFTGSKEAAQAAQLVYYVAGSEAALRDARAILEVSSRKIVVVGDQPGQAAVVKIATNLLTASAVQSLAEALALTRAAGVDLPRFQEALQENGSRSATVERKLRGMLAGDYEAHFSLKHMFKDAHLALLLGADHGVNLPVTATTAALLFGGLQRGWGDLDFSVLFRNYDPLPPPPPPSGGPREPVAGHPDPGPTEQAPAPEPPSAARAEPGGTPPGPGVSVVPPPSDPPAAEHLAPDRPALPEPGSVTSTPTPHSPARAPEEPLTTTAAEPAAADGSVPELPPPESIGWAAGPSGPRAADPLPAADEPVTAGSAAAGPTPPTHAATPDDGPAQAPAFPHPADVDPAALPLVPPASYPVKPPATRALRAIRAIFGGGSKRGA